MTPRGLGEVSGTAPGRAAAVWGRISQPGFGSDKTAAATNAANSEGSLPDHRLRPERVFLPHPRIEPGASRGIPERERARAGQRCGPTTTPRPARPAHSTGGEPAGHLLFGFTGADGKEASNSAGGYASHRRFYQPQVALPPTADNGLRTRTPRCQSRRRLPLTDPQTTQPGEKNPTKQSRRNPKILNEAELKPPENRAALAGGPYELHLQPTGPHCYPDTERCGSEGGTGADGRANRPGRRRSGRVRQPLTVFTNPRLRPPPTADNGLRTRTPRCQSR